MTTPGLVTLIGSGEVSAGMVKVHRELLEDLGLRDRLLVIGFELRDTPEGTVWARRGA